MQPQERRIELKATVTTDGSIVTGDIRPPLTEDATKQLMAAARQTVKLLHENEQLRWIRVTFPGAGVYVLTKAPDGDLFCITYAE